jgi:hypothetical protein
VENQNFQSDNSASKLAKFVCKVVKSEKIENQNLRLVSIDIGHNNFPSSLADEILHCIPNDVIYYVASSEKGKFIHPEKADVVIAIADFIDVVSGKFFLLTNLN